MSVLIVEAYSDENGKARGGQPGDQNGKEIRVREWYERADGWDVYLECTDAALADRAAEIAERISANAAFGYNQDDRWSGHRSILKTGDIDTAAGDYDCSSLCISAYILAGLDVKAEGYTKNIERILVDTGKFKSYKDAAHTGSADLAKRGGLYLAAGHHVLMVLEDGEGAQQTDGEAAGTPEPDGGTNPLPEQTDGARVVSKGSVRVRDKPIDGKVMTTLHDGESLPYLSTWHQVDVDGKPGWISGKSKYTEVRE